MPVEYALPALYRGKMVVVSGDEKQLPPTSFFSSKVENDEAELFDDDEPEDAAIDERARGAAETWNRREIKDCPDLLHLAREVLPPDDARDPLPVGIPRTDRLLERRLLRQPAQRAGPAPATIKFARRSRSSTSSSTAFTRTRPTREAERIAVILRSTWRDLGARPSDWRRDLQPQAGRPDRGAPGGSGGERRRRFA